MHCLTPKVLVTRTVPQSRALSDNFWFVANVKVYECKHLKLSVLDRINGLGSFAEPLVSVQGYGAKPPEAESLFAFGRLIVQYFAVFIRFSGDNCMKHFKIWALLYWWWICRRGGGQNFPRAAPPAGAGAECATTRPPYIWWGGGLLLPPLMNSLPHFRFSVSNYGPSGLRSVPKTDSWPYPWQPCKSLTLWLT